MSFSADITTFFQASTGNALKTGGSLTVVKQLTGLTEVFEAQAVITNTSVDDFNLRTIWTTGDGDVDDFDFLFIENLNTVAANSMIVSLITDQAGTPLFANLTIPASNYLLLPNGGMTNIALTDGSVETGDLIDQIKFKNDITGASADVTLTARLVLLT